VSTPRLGVDIGRTFTDFALLDEARGELTVLKLPSTPERPSASVFEGVEALRGRRSLDPGAMMAAAPSGREVLGRHRGVRERLQDLAVGRDQLDLEIQGQGDELAVIGRASRSKCEVEDRTGRHAVLEAGEQAFRIARDSRRLVEIQDAPSDQADQRVPELGSPEERRRLHGVPSQHALRAACVLPLDVEVDDQVGVGDDHGRPAVFNRVRRRSVSRTPLGLTRTSRIRASSASGSTGVACTMASRQAITSRLRLRRWSAA